MNFSSLQCFELGKLVLSSGLLHSLWNRISAIHASPASRKQGSGLGFEIYHETKYTIVVFVSPPNCSTSSSASTHLSGPQDQNPFHFLCSEKISSFSLHKPAFQLFLSGYNNNSLRHLKLELLNLLKSKIPVIITGAALGGSVASLFTLWLLETVEPKLTRPLCITFGSPLIGDASLLQILENSLRISCFLHVAYASKTLINTDFKPFGKFLICADSECICIDDTEGVMELLGGAADTDVLVWRDYGEVLDHLAQPVAAFCEDHSSRRMIGEVIINGMKERAAKKKLRFDPVRKLDDIKISMIHVEWYKKFSNMAKIGYYDQFKTEPVFHYELHRRMLDDYWESMVQEVEKMPQSEKSILKKRCLYSANNYRRLMEPLYIANYYLEGKKEYRTTGRPYHYVMLEKWFKQEESKEPDRCKRRDLSDLLTFGSCFWAEVEESLLVINQLKTQVAIEDVETKVLLGKLLKFEEYVWEKIRKREVSPEIFLEKSSFMKWWKEYKKIKGFTSSPSDFTEFMNTRNYESYGRSAEYT